MKNLILSNWKYLLLPVLALTGLLAFLFNAIEIGACFYLKTRYKFPFWDLNAFLKHYRSEKQNIANAFSNFGRMGFSSTCHERVKFRCFILRRGFVAMPAIDKKTKNQGV